MLASELRELLFQGGELLRERQLFRGNLLAQLIELLTALGQLLLGVTRQLVHRVAHGGLGERGGGQTHDAGESDECLHGSLTGRGTNVGECLPSRISSVTSTSPAMVSS